MKKMVLGAMVLAASMAVLSGCSKANDTTVTVSVYTESGNGQSITVDYADAGTLHQELKGLKYSNDKLCDCMSQYVFTFEDGSAYEIKHYSAEDDAAETDSIVKSGTGKQADSNETIDGHIAEVMELVHEQDADF